MLHRRHERLIREIVYRRAKEAGIKLYRYVNVGNHLHLLLKSESNRYVAGKKAFQRFLRKVTGEIAMLVTGARKTNGVGGFWDGLAFTRLVDWGRAYEWLCDYFFKNLLEAGGLPKHAAEEVKRMTAELRRMWDDWAIAGVMTG